MFGHLRLELHVMSSQQVKCNEKTLTPPSQGMKTPKTPTHEPKIHRIAHTFERATRQN